MIPRFKIMGTTFCWDNDDGEGHTLVIRWGRFIFELAFGRFPK